jgi:hypothetical protein
VRETAPEVTPLTARFIRAWALIGVLALVVWVAVEPFRPLAPPLRASLDEAARAAREAVAGRGFQVGPAWRVMPIADDGHGDSHRFVWDEGGRDRYASLLGRYLPTPRWLVRVATFEGDVADRAEEWTVLVNHRGQAERVAHQIPESRAAPSLDESAARQIALDAVQQTLALPASSLREVSVAPSKLAARTDWLFTFQDTTVETIPIRAAAPNAPANASAVRGEARIEVEIGGRDAVRVRPFVHVPEEWQRQQRGRDTLLRIIGILGAVLAGSTLVAAAGSGLVAWSHREFSRRIFVSLFVLFAVLSIVVAVNNWPTVTATLSTAQPYALQVWMRVGIGLVALLVPAALLGLAGGTLALEMPLRRQIPRTTAAILGMSLGFVVLAAAAATRAGGEPPWPDVSALGTFVPPLAAAIGRLPSLLLRTVTLMVLLSVVDHMSRGWTRQRVLLGLALIVAGAVLAAPPADTMLGWVVAAALVGVVFLCAYIFLLRFDMSIVPFAMATIVGASLLRDALSGTALGVAAGSIAGIVLAAVMAWWICGQLREARARQAAPPA